MNLRGKCKAYCQALCAIDSRLRLVRGWYHESDGQDRYQHWWCELDDGSIVDPTVTQFRTTNGSYERFDGTAPCELCGDKQKEQWLRPYGSKVFCSHECLKMFKDGSRSEQKQFLMDKIDKKCQKPCLNPLRGSIEKNQTTCNRHRS